MDYSSLVRDAWGTTWRNQYLWGLALFAGGAVGVGGRSGLRWDRGVDGREWSRAGDMDGFGPLQAWRRGDWRPEEAAARVREIAEGAAQWAVAHAGLVALGVVAVVMLAVGLLALGLIARGGMAEATVDLATGRRSSFGRMWRAGTRLMWRYAGLWLLLATASLVLVALAGGSVAAGVAAAAATGMPRLVWGLGALVAIPLALVGAVVGIAASVTMAYAERAIYAEDAGPVDALKAGWRVLRGNPAASALLWLLNVALTIGIGIVVALAGMVVVGVLGSAGAAIWFAAGWSVPLLAYGVLGLLAVATVLLAAGAVVNAFFWNYWTLAYVRLTGRAA